MSGKYALIIGNTEYTDPGLAQLTSPGKDTEDFARVLKDQEIGAFDHVNILLNQLSSSIIEAIDEFFDEKKPDDLLVLYFSGHGVRDELGTLYLAVANTNRARLRSTAIKSDYIREAMDQSRSKRQVLILDCYNSGSYAQGTKAATGASIGTATAFESGYGRIILTANDSTQFAWKGDTVIGETSDSRFTHFLIEGLEGEADLDGDGRITVDELYDYAYEKVRLATPKQSPSKFTSKQQGEIILRQSMRLEDIKPVPLPVPLLDSIDNPFPDVRLGVVQQLIKLLNGKNLGLARSAREALERIVKEDDSRTVSRSAYQALEAIRQAEELPVQKTVSKQQTKEAADQLIAEKKAEEERKAKKEAKHLAALKAKEERLAREKVEAERKVKEQAERLLAEQNAEEKRIAREEVERIAIQNAEQDRLARQKAEAESLERTQLEPKSVTSDATLLEAEVEATKNTNVERTDIEIPEHLPSKKKLDEEHDSKAKIKAVAPELSESPESKGLTRTHSQARRAPTKKISSGSLAPSALPKPFVGNWPWIAVALVFAAGVALFAAVGGYILWRTTQNQPQETPPPLVEVTRSDATLISSATTTVISTNTANPIVISSPQPTNSPQPTTPYFTTTQNTFCYDGPGTGYDHHWELYIGQIAEVFAKWSGNPDWLVVDINEPALTRTDCCWVNSSKGTLNVTLDQIESTGIVPDRMDCSALE
jgi:hypothetical protein